MQRGELFIVSAPSGTGKTTLIHRLMGSGLARSGALHFSVSHTTRAPRGTEVDGKDYHFVENQLFQSMIDDGAFLEWANYAGNFYGTSIEEVRPKLDQGIDVILEIDVQGAEGIRDQQPDAHSIFIMPPSYQVLHDRLVNRGLEDTDVRARRLAVSLSELKRYAQYDYAIINDDLDRASEALAAIILAKRHRVERLEHEAHRLLDDFKAHLESS